MKDFSTDKQFSNNLSYSNFQERKVIIILYFKIVQINDTMKLVLFSTIESNILTDKKQK